MAKKRKKHPAKKAGAPAQSAADKPAADKSAADKPAADKSAADKHTADKSAADKRGDDKPAADKSAADKSAADKRGDDKPAADKRGDEKRADKRGDEKRADKRGDAKPLSRGAQRRQAARASRANRPQPITPAAPIDLGPAEEPTFWFGFEVPWAKLLVVRVVVFALFAVDALMQIEHAPRYGAGGFNVAQLPLLDVLAPGRVAYLCAQLVLAYLFVLAACGALTRYVLPIATAIYGWLYFSSHLDSYQHHYLVWLILLLSCFVPWQRPAGTPATNPVRSWALRLILIQLALLYFWAAVSKMNGAWLDGTALSKQIFGPVRWVIDHTVRMKGAAIGVLATELVLAATVWNKRTWFIAAPLGLALHAGILATSLEIGLFAYLMLGIYTLVVPDRIYTFAVRKLPSFDRITNVFRGSLPWLLWFVAALAGIVLSAISNFDHSVVIGLVLLAVFFAATFLLRKRVTIARLAVAHLLAFGVWTAVDRASLTASDYYRLWGGSAKRLGDPATSEYAYRKATEVAPFEGAAHYQLGKLLLDRNADDEAIAELHKAQWYEPNKARAYVAEARWLASKDRKDEALEKATIALMTEPNDSEANALYDSLTKK